MSRRGALSWAEIERRGRPRPAAEPAIYGCDYGHNHRSAEAKRKCEERNDNRGLPRGAR